MHAIIIGLDITTVFVIQLLFDKYGALPLLLKISIPIPTRHSRSKLVEKPTRHHNIPCMFISN